MRGSLRRSAGRLFVGLAAAGLLVNIPVLDVHAAAPTAGTAGPAYQQTKTLTRTHLNSDGSETEVTRNNVTVSVDKTAALYGREDVNVKWTGAIATGGIQPDPNSTSAPNQEYPVALLECRGTPAQVTPQTCWTHGASSRYAAINFTAFPAFRVDRYAASADRAAVVGRPDSAPDACGGSATSEHWVPFVGANGKSYPYGNNGCAGIPPEDYLFDSTALAVPPNVTFAATSTDGSGSAKFDVWTDAEDASLGCNASVACTLEVIPIVGISCDPYGVSKDSAPLPPEDVPDSSNASDAARFCEAGPNYRPGDLVSGGNSASLPVSGRLWWSASNWRNRFAVPLNFAKVSRACNVTGGGAPVDVYGSELMTEAAGQWAPRFCSDPTLFKFGHVATADPLAKRLIADPTSGVYGAFSSLSPAGGFSSPTVQAPVSVTGFSVSFNIDDANGRPVQNLRLTPRLLAKLLTESYPGDDFDRFGDNPYHHKTFTDANGFEVTLPYLERNPINITQDPEFQALNPGIVAPNATPGAATLFVPSEESDAVHQLTAYIWADPEARAWLNGQADPWGMVVNPYYSATLKPYFQTSPLTLPVDRWPLLDTTTPDFGGNGNVPCNADPTDATPWLPLVANPTPNFAATTLAVQFASAPSKIRCAMISDQVGAPSQWLAIGRSSPGQRFIIGLTSLGQARRFDLQSASLQSQSTVSDPTQKFTDAKGRTFVAPTEASLQAAVKYLQPDSTTNTWSLPVDSLRTASGAGGAYPGTMLVNADIPTSGVPGTAAKDFAQLLRYAAGAGQVPGAADGQLPDGYLPMTAANGLGAEVAYTLRAADAVQAQQGATVPLVAAPGTPPSSGPPSASSAPPAQTGPPAPSGPLLAPGASTPKGTSTPAAASPAPSGTVLASGRTPLFGAGAFGALLPVLLAAGMAAAAVSGGLLARPRPGTVPVSRRRRIRLRRPGRR